MAWKRRKVANRLRFWKLTSTLFPNPKYPMTRLARLSPRGSLTWTLHRTMNCGRIFPSTQGRLQITPGVLAARLANWLELGGDFFDGLNQEALWSRLVKKLVSLGYQVTLTP